MVCTSPPPFFTSQNPLVLYCFAPNRKSSSPFAGGGFALPTTAGHLEFLNSLSKMANQNNKSAAILLLDYDTAPALQYPEQLTQTVELLRYTTTILNHTPSSIILASDSIGGSLILGLLGHILHPHLSISPLKLKEPLRGAAMSSLVVDFDFSKLSFARARLIDPALVSTLDRWIADYVSADSYAEDFYLQPSRALMS
jgi:acetyl esterase/lipase